MVIGKKQLLSLYRTMVRIRTFEEAARREFLDGKMAGFLHLYSGEEAVAAGVCACLNDDDYITSTHRGHGHCLAKGADSKRMMAELYGKATGYSKGKGGSMHIADLSKGVIGANGIVGASMPIAVGVAYAQHYKRSKSVTVAFFGDGASNRGTFHEAINMASVLNLPVIFVCENNGFGMSTPQRQHQKIKKISQRGAAYDIPGVTVDGNDPIAVYEAAKEAIDSARRGGGPSIIECLTWRHHGHYLGDPAPYKPEAEQKRWLSKENDPIPRFEERLISEKKATKSELTKIKSETEAEIADAMKFSWDSPFPEPEELYTDVFI